MGRLSPSRPLALVFALVSLLCLPGCKDQEPAENAQSPLSEQPPARSRSETVTAVRDSQETWIRLDDPARDGWDSEVFAAEAASQLKQLGQLLTGAAPVAPADLDSLATPDARSSALIPSALAEEYRDGSLRVQRATKEAAVAAPTDTLVNALNQFAAPFRTDSRSHIKFKVIAVSLNAPDTATTRQLLEITCRTKEGLLEQHGEWEIVWSRDRSSAAPKIHTLRIVDFERSELAAPEPLFSDCTESVLGTNQSYRDQLLFGMNHWLERFQDTRKMALLGTPGLALGDVNSDGLDDLYLCQPGGLPNRLYLQQPDGTLSDATEPSQSGWLESSRSALLLDLDNDGDQDLAVATFARLVIAENDGSGRFTARTMLETGTDTMSLSAADADLDGDLDLYLCTYSPSDLEVEAGATVIGATGDFHYHDANNGGANQFFRNDHTAATPWRFTDLTAEAGLDVRNRRFSFAASWEDYDNDGDQDLYVANDFGLNTLYRNDSEAGGSLRFSEVAENLAAQDQASGMSVSWSDFDRDGRMDLYIGNMFSAAGRRIAPQRGFSDQAPPAVRKALLRFARGNTLFANRGDRFDDLSLTAGVTMGRWAWSSCFADLNNDGWDDLAIANGYITTDDPGDL